MTEDEREKFDAIRMTLELTGHDLESMRDRMEIVSRQVTELRVASEAQRLSIQSQEHKYDDLREDIRSLAKSTAELLKVSGAHEVRLNKLEGRVQ